MGEKQLGQEERPSEKLFELKKTKFNRHDHTTLEILGRFACRQEELNFTEVIKIYIPKHLFNLKPEEYHELFKIHMRLRSKIDHNLDIQQFLYEPQKLGEFCFTNQLTWMPLGRSFKNYTARAESMWEESWKQFVLEVLRARFVKKDLDMGARLKIFENIVTEKINHFSMQRAFLHLGAERFLHREVHNPANLQLQHDYLALLDFVSHLMVRFYLKVMETFSKEYSLNFQNEQKQKWQEALISKLLLEVDKVYEWRVQFDLTVPHENDAREMAHFEFEYNALKKFFYQPFYIDFQAETKVSNFLLHSGQYLAAFFAGAWAFAFNAILFDPNSQFKYGQFGFWTLTLLSALAYGLKDRIKEVARNYFKDALSDKFALDKMETFSAQVPQFKQLTASVKEFYKMKEEKLPPAFLRDRFIEKINFNCLLYKRQIRFKKKKNDPPMHLKEIWRIHLEPFLDHLDDTDKKVFARTRGSSLTVKTFPREYYFPLVFEIYSPKREIQEAYHYLLVANNKGIIRLENWGEQNDSHHHMRINLLPLERELG